MRRSAAVATGALLALPLLAGCKELEAEARSVYEPSTVREVDGGKGKQITYTERGAAAVGLTLATVGRQGSLLTVPYASLIYDGQGVSYVYVSSSHLTFQKAEVRIVRVEDDQVLLASGPPPGTRVVTVGAAELFGSELGIEGKH